MASVTPTPDEKTGSRRTTWIVGALVLIVGAVAVVSAMGSVNMKEVTETFEGVSLIELDLENSPVVVTAGDGGAVRIEKRFTTGWFGGSNRSEQNGDQLRLIQRCPSLFGFGCRARYEVTVPADATVIGRTSNGSITIERLTGPIDVDTSNGSVEVIIPDDSPSYALSTTTSNGTVGTAIRTDPAATDNMIDISTSNGDITVRYP